MTPGTVCLEERIIRAKEINRAKWEKKHIRIQHWKVKQALEILMSNFYLRLSKEMIVKNFTIVFKEKNVPA